VIVVRSTNGVPMRLTQERWRHIIARHPEAADQKDRVLETISAPDVIQEGDLDTLLCARSYDQTLLSEKLLVVIYKEVSEIEGFILTAYFTNELSKRRRVLWSR